MMKPGCIYTDRKGRRYLYLGFGNLFENKYAAFRNVYVYMDMKKFDKLVAQGQLAVDLSSFTGSDNNSTGLPYFLNIRESPMKLVDESEEEFFTEDKFFPLKVLDYTPHFMKFRGAPTEYELKQKRKC